MPEKPRKKPGPVPRGEMERVNVRVRDDLRDAVDAYAKENGLDRSAVIRIGVAKLLGKPELAEKAKGAV